MSDSTSPAAASPAPPAAPSPTAAQWLGDALADLMVDVRKVPEQAREWAGILPNWQLFAVLLGAWILLFHFFGNATLGYIDTPSLLGWMDYAYRNSEDDQLGHYVPFIVLGLLWWKRTELAAIKKEVWWPALFLVLISLAIHLLGYIVQQTRISIVGFYFGIYALTGVVWGPRWLIVTFFPAFLFAFGVPLGNQGASITVPLRLLATTITVTIANLTGFSVQQAGNFMIDPNDGFKFEVAAACSGIRSLTAIFLMASIVSFLMFKTWWRRIVVLSSAIPLAVISNVLRLLGIVVVAKLFGQKAGHDFHDNTVLMLMLYVPGIVGVLALASWLDKGERAARRREAQAKGGTP